MMGGKAAAGATITALRAGPGTIGTTPRMGPRAGVLASCATMDGVFPCRRAERTVFCRTSCS